MLGIHLDALALLGDAIMRRALEGKSFLLLLGEFFPFVQSESHK